ncbi:uncharacterized protein LOC117333933 [Pecten maximus]|uniref:uncharacterized protein LOC117333933 n=1 Tax=Pecten maximus TaxID=6579 RepID=UPI001458ACBE|nr:uncharacterized protein LOC117333933 [Pecten maximus]
MPESIYPIQLHLANNNISHLENRDYLKHVSFLDLSDNPVATLTKAAVHSLGTAAHVIMKGHKLQSLPETIRLLDPDQFEFGKAPIPCDCDNTWIGEWKRIKGDNFSGNPLWCSTNKVVMEAQEVTDDFLHCTKTTNIKLISIMASGFGVFMLVVTAILVVIYFKFEILLFTRRLRIKKQHRSWMHDIYLSFDDENDDVRFFVLTILRPFLLEKGYEVYTPCLDTDVGKVKESELKLHTYHSRSILVVLSEHSRLNVFTVIEYKCAFSYFTEDGRRNMVLLDFDHATPMNNDTLIGSKALKRFGYYIAITDRNIKVCNKLVQMFGPPTSRAEKDE